MFRAAAAKAEDSGCVLTVQTEPNHIDERTEKAFISGVSPASGDASGALKVQWAE